jgi:hypothetical protein
MTRLSDGYKMRDLAFLLWGKKDISLTNNPFRQSNRARGRCYKVWDKSEKVYFFVIHLYQMSNLKTIAHEIAHAYTFDTGHGVTHEELTEQLYQAYISQNPELKEEEATDRYFFRRMR